MSQTENRQWRSCAIAGLSALALAASGQLLTSHGAEARPCPFAEKARLERENAAALLLRQRFRGPAMGQPAPGGPLARLDLAPLERNGSQPLSYKIARALLHRIADEGCD